MCARKCTETSVGAWEVIFHEIAPIPLNHMNWTLCWVLLRIVPHKACISSTWRLFAQRGDSEALNSSTAAEWSPYVPCFLPSSPLFRAVLLSFSLLSASFERKKHMFSSKGRHIKHKLFLVKGRVLFQGQRETLSWQQRAIRALAMAQVCAEYICSVNICIQHINGLDRPLITD